MHKSNQAAKQLSELGFWTTEYVNRGHTESRFDDPATRYREQLQIDENTFHDQIIVDVGCGPVGALRSFDARLKFGVDVLARSYQPFGIADHGIIYLAAPAEDLPFLDQFVDAVVSLNALDHVDRFEDSIREIHRILKVDGRIYLGFNLNHTPTLQEPHLLTQDRVLQALSGLFSVTKAQVIPLAPDSVIQAPGGMLMVHGFRLPSPVSPYQQATLDLIDEVRHNRTTTEARDLEYTLRYGAPNTVIAERAAATAFVEYRDRHPQWRKRLLRAVAIAFIRRPRMVFNVGLWSITFRSLLAHQELP